MTGVCLSSQSATSEQTLRFINIISVYGKTALFY
jgi:hypothetical protein